MIDFQIIYFSTLLSINANVCSQKKKKKKAVYFRDIENDLWL